ncbi:MAG TPA: phosphoglycolate phosphatase [Porticoccaceae bacterium]|nr:phosphoglycolate phosphatase [Porticoccaceae bacterium]
MKPETFKAVLFDLDGTLLDTAPDFAIALNCLLERKKRPPLPAAHIRAMVSNGSAGLVAHAFGCSEQEADFEQIRKEFLDIYLDILCQQTRPFPGMLALLEALQARQLAWGIVTNKPRLYTEAILQELELVPAPDTVVCPDDVSNTKPDPEPILLACRQLAVEPTQAVMIGDHRRDIESGLNAGSITIAAAYGYVDDDPPHSWGAHYLAEDVAALRTLLL